MNLTLAAILAVACMGLAACAQNRPASDYSSPEASSQANDDPRARIHTELGAQYFARGMHAIALQELNEALQADGRYAPAHNMLGLVHGELREDAQAEAAFRRAIELSPNYSEAHNNYGWFLCERGRIDQALARFELAIANPLYATPDKALANAGLCSLRGNDERRAEDYLRRALIRSPYQPVALQQMARLYARQGRALDARNVLLRLSERGPLDAADLWLGVRVERKLADRSAENSYASQLLRRFPNSREVYWLNSGQYDQPGMQP